MSDSCDLDQSKILSSGNGLRMVGESISFFAFQNIAVYRDIKRGASVLLERVHNGAQSRNYDVVSTFLMKMYPVSGLTIQ